jgi:hypothetical protein
MMRAGDIMIAIQIRRDKSKAGDEAVELVGRSLSLSLSLSARSGLMT